MSWAGTLIDFKDGVSFTGAGNSDTTPSFTLLGGKYLLSTASSGTPGATLETLLPDGSTFQAIGNPVTTTAVAFDLPPGTYEIVMGAAAGTASGSLTRVPVRAA